VSLAIVETESGALLASKHIGEIWIHSKYFPRHFWLLPTRSETFLRARPVLLSPETNENAGAFPLSRTVTDDPLWDGSASCTIEWDYVRTGLFGFLLTSQQIPSLPAGKSLLFVTGLKCDRIHRSIPENPQQAETFFRNHIVDTTMRKVHGIDCW
jgi:acyl-CoA synthetase (AMP-forming)/AMP-acid ligase II